MSKLRFWTLPVGIWLASMGACHGSCGDASSAPPSPGRAPDGRDAPSATEAASAAASGHAPRPECRARPEWKVEGFDPCDPAFEFDPEHFQRKRPPGPSDWLARFPTPHVTFDEYVRLRPTTRTEQRNTLVIQPIGRLDAAERARLALLREFMEAFFDARTELARPVPLPSQGYRVRQHQQSPIRQYRTGVLLDELLAPRLPANAIATLGVTQVDLYPDEKWNFVFGEASLEDRVGVYSLLRYSAAYAGERDTPETARLELLRSFKVLAHETGHMFSVHHCTHNECLMNGSNSLDETDRSPLHLCPLCLKKLAYALRFDVRARYRRLHDIYERAGLRDEASWIASRLASLDHVP